MQPFQHLLVPTDFSEPAREALGRALDLASKFDAKITLLHVFQQPLFVYAADVYIPTEELAMRAGDALAQAAGDARARWPKIEEVLTDGVIWEQIVSVSKSCGADLVVMGTNGRRGVSRALLGSVAEKVVRMSQVPVLTVRPPEKAAGAVEAQS